MKKHLLLAIAAIVAASSCVRETLVPVEDNAFIATTESASTKTSLSQSGEGYKVLWSNGDRITIVDASSNVGEYVTDATTSQAVFTHASGQQAVKADFEAWYPASIYNGGTPTLPEVQTYEETNIASAPMYARGSTTSLSFKNLCGIVKLNLSTTLSGKKVSKIILSANKGLSGAFTVSDDAAVVTGKGDLTLDCGKEGVAIGTTAVPFFVAVPAGTYNQFKITVITTDGEVQTRSSSTDIIIARSSVVSISLGFGELAATKGSSPAIGTGAQGWVQLWPGGPRWAMFNVGSTISSYEGLTEYAHPSVIGGYYSINGRLDAAPDANNTEDTAYTIWGPNWATPTRDQLQGLIDNCDWTFCDGETLQYEPGCTLKGWKVSGKEPGYFDASIFLPLCGTKDQNRWGPIQMGSRGTYWSNGTGNRYFLELKPDARNIPYHDPDHGCSVRAICVADEPLVEGVYTISEAYPKATLYQFENYAGDTPKLVFGADWAQDVTITRPDAEIDLGGYSVPTLYLQNNDPEKTVTVKNGTITNGIDGKDGQTDCYAGQVVLEDLTLNNCFWTDGHAVTIKSGVYPEIQHKKDASTPGTLTILSGSFGDVYRYVDRYGGSEDGSTMLLSGGVYKIRPANKWCADGYYVTSNTGADSATYPYKVVEGDPSANWFTGSAIDLSAGQTANTYIISAPGTYKIKATVKGNGGLDPLTGTTATPINASDISGAVVLWELGGAGLTIKYEDEFHQIGYKDGYIWFNTADIFTAGDAYVAVFKDCDGGKAGAYDKDVDQVLWSWLIWATEEPVVTPILDKDLIIMDRNLGATGTGNVGCRGLMYEWGRKDPFPSPNNGSYTPNSFYPERMTAFSISDFDAEGMTVAYSIAHPTTYIKGWSKGYWQTESEFSLNMWWSGEKTIYDPCPAGWKVPSKEEMQTVADSGVNLPGNGFLGNCRSDFEYGNPGSLYYWTSTGSDRDCAWGYTGKIRNDHVDDKTRSGWSIRPVKEMIAKEVPTVPGSANTFLITTAGAFTFDATVKGNGGLDPLTGEQATRIDKADIAGVKVLWEVYEQGRAIKHDGEKYVLSYADGKVTLSTPDVLTSGAACVAIFDSSDKILWSWLIWTSPEVGTKDHNEAVFMDRNLGAVDAGYCMRGFLFEWGRKDAFSAANGGYEVYPFVPLAKDVFTWQSATLTIAESVANPTLWSRHDYSWMPEAEYVWKPWREKVKTIYDPCPEGWRVPTKDQMSGISGMPDTGIGGGYDPDAYYKGFGNPGTGYNWTASSDVGADDRAYAFVNDGRNIQHWAHNQGYAIRCVKQ